MTELEMAAKLAAYEATGLTPEEIVNLLKRCSELNKSTKRYPLSNKSDKLVLNKRYYRTLYWNGILDDAHEVIAELSTDDPMEVCLGGEFLGEIGGRLKGVPNTIRANADSILTELLKEFDENGGMCVEYDGVLYEVHEDGNWHIRKKIRREIHAHVM